MSRRARETRRRRRRTDPRPGFPEPVAPIRAYLCACPCDPSRSRCASRRNRNHRSAHNVATANAAGVATRILTRTPLANSTIFAAVSGIVEPGSLATTAGANAAAVRRRQNLPLLVLAPAPATLRPSQQRHLSHPVLYACSQGLLTSTASQPDHCLTRRPSAEGDGTTPLLRTRRSRSGAGATKAPTRIVTLYAGRE